MGRCRRPRAAVLARLGARARAGPDPQRLARSGFGHGSQRVLVPPLAEQFEQLVGSPMVSGGAGPQPCLVPPVAQETCQLLGREPVPDLCAGLQLLVIPAATQGSIGTASLGREPNRSTSPGHLRHIVKNY
jgi:hypothetical protein